MPAETERAIKSRRRFPRTGAAPERLDAAGLAELEDPPSPISRTAASCANLRGLELATGRRRGLHVCPNDLQVRGGSPAVTERELPRA